MAHRVLPHQLHMKDASLDGKDASQVAVEDVEVEALGPPAVLDEGDLDGPGVERAPFLHDGGDLQVPLPALLPDGLKVADVPLPAFEDTEPQMVADGRRLGQVEHVGLRRRLFGKADVVLRVAQLKGREFSPQLQHKVGLWEGVSLVGLFGGSNRLDRMHREPHDPRMRVEDEIAFPG